MHIHYFLCETQSVKSYNVIVMPKFEFIYFVMQYLYLSSPPRKQNKMTLVI